MSSTALRPSRLLTYVTGLALGISAAAVPASADPAPASIEDSHSFAGWTQRIRTGTDATFVADTNTATDGGTSLRIDNATPRGPNLYAELFQDVPVTPETTYQLSASVRGENLPDAAAVLITSNDWVQRIPLPQGTYNWQEITWELTTDPGETVHSWRMLLEDVGSVWIDDVTMTAPGSTDNLLTNSSFEEYNSSPGDDVQIGVPATTLVLRPGAATIPVTAQVPELAYTVTDVDGAPAAQGDLDTTNGDATIDVGHLSPGYYSLNLESTGVDASVLDTSFTIVDEFTDSAVGLDSPFGVSYHPPEFPTRPELAATIGPLGASYGRIDYPWSQVELSPGEYTFPGYLQDQVDEMLANGVRPLIILDYRNQFYDDNRTPSTPEGLAAFGNYAAAVADHFGASVDYEVYNEPNNHFNDGLCGRTADCYMDLLVAASQRIRDVLPDATIAGPAIVGDTAWLTRFAELGGLQYIDAVTFHPYNHPDGPDTYHPTMIAEAVQLVEDYAQSDHEVEVWVTETGWPTRTGYVSEQQQANYLTRYMASSIAAGADRTYWYEITDAGQDAGDLEQMFGMMRYFSAAVPAYAPKPAFFAYTEAVRYLSDAEFIAEDNLDDGGYGYAFDGGTAGPVRVLWATTDQEVTVDATEEITVTDAYGRQSQIGPGEVTLTLTERPVYLLGRVADVDPAPESIYAVTTADVTTLDEPLEIDVSVDHRDHAGPVQTPVTFRASTGQQILVPARTGELTSNTLVLPAAETPGEREVSVDLLVGGEVVMQERLTVTVADHRSTYTVEPLFSTVDPLDASVGITVANSSIAADLEVTDVTWSVDGAQITDAQTTAMVPVDGSATLTAQVAGTQLWHSYPFTATVAFADGVTRELSGTLGFNPVLPEGQTPELAADLAEVGNEVVLTEASTGSDDLSGTVRVSRTSETLVLHASVTDDLHDNTVDAPNMWQADSIQFAVSPVLPEQASSYVELGAGLGPAGAAVQRFSGSGGPVPEADVTIDRDETAGVTDYRVEIPWSVVGLSVDTTTFGFSMLVNDADGDGRSGYLEWGAGIGATKDPSQYLPMRMLEVAPESEPAVMTVNAESSSRGRHSHVTVTATNEDTAPVDVRFTLPSGATVSFDDVPAGNHVEHRFTTVCDLPAGEASVHTSVEREGALAEETLVAPYDAEVCLAGRRGPR